MTTLAAVAGGSKAMWYLTRGSGVVTLLLLTASVWLGVSGVVRRPGGRVPRFTTAALHRNLSLLAVVFLGVHVVTTVADTYAPIGWKDAVLPFGSTYRPLWLGLGALASDLVLALVVTSLLRLRLGVRVWRSTHRLAYACWPVALLHSLGTGSDARAGWLQLLGAGCVAVVLGAVGLRLARGGGDAARRIAIGAAVLGLTGAGFAWYRGGPGAAGWAARSGTPAALLKHATAVTGAAAAAAPLPATFHARLTGAVTQSGPGSNGLVDLHIDTRLRNGVRGRLRLDLQGVPLENGGVSMTGSGVAFAAAGTSVYEGRIVALDGNRVEARVSDGSGHTVHLLMTFELSPTSNALSGTVRGSSVIA